MARVVVLSLILAVLTLLILVQTSEASPAWAHSRRKVARSGKLQRRCKQRPPPSAIGNVAASPIIPSVTAPLPPPSLPTPESPQPSPKPAQQTQATQPAASPPPKPSPSPAPAPVDQPAPEPKPVTQSATQPAPAPTQPAQQQPSSNGQTSQSDIDLYLSSHNTIRAQHGAAPLTWSDDLASKAQQWANGCVFQHSGGSLGPFGENLAAGTGSGYGITQAVKSWTDEVSSYDPNNPQPSHFTQVVWKGSTQVGCALQNCNGIFAASFGLAHYYVCEYSPQGNIIGQFPENVQV